MDFNGMKTQIDTMMNDNYEDFVKAFISVEKGMDDMTALNELYNAYMDNDGMNLLNDDFDDLIEDMREQGLINEGLTSKENLQSKENMKEIVGNIVGDVKFSERESENGSFNFKVANFSVVSKDNDGNKHYDNISAYGKLADEAKKLNKGDFIKLEGEEKQSVGKDGKEYISVKASHIKLLKAREQMKDNKDNEKISTLGMIKELKEKAKTKEAKDKVGKAMDAEL